MGIMCLIAVQKIMFVYSMNFPVVASLNKKCCLYWFSFCKIHKIIRFLTSQQVRWQLHGDLLSLNFQIISFQAIL